MVFSQSRIGVHVGVHGLWFIIEDHINKDLAAKK